MNSTVWFFRKKRALGNFSIEHSFREIRNAWPESPKPLWIQATQFSEGWLNRWNIIRQTRAIVTDVLHITGDIHFAALAWPKWRRNRPQVVLTIHDIGFIHDHTGWKRWLMKKIWITWPLRCVDQLVTVSEATKEDVLKEATWFDPTKITVIPTVVPQHFKPRNSGTQQPQTHCLAHRSCRKQKLARSCRGASRSGCSPSHHWGAIGRRSSHVEAIGS